jgi:hypothetical protein
MAHNHGGGSSSGMAGMMGMGMDMTTGATMFQPVNEYITHLLWYLVTAVVAIGLVGQILQRGNAWLR